MGSLCCVAAKPQVSAATSGDWSVGPCEPCWRTNSSFSPLQSRWDFRFQSEACSFGSQDGVVLYGSSASSNSRGSRGLVRGNNLANHQFLVPDGIGPYFSSPSDISSVQQWTPPAIQEIGVDDYGNKRDVFRPLPFSPRMEGTSAVQDSGGSTSSQSDSSCDDESLIKSHSSHHDFANRHCFTRKAVHPLSFPLETLPREKISIVPAGLLESDRDTPQGDGHHLSSASGSIDIMEIPESSRFRSPSDHFKCGLCEQFLSQRSPWSTRKIIKSGDNPVAGILSCRHVFHAECLEQTTPKVHKIDPPCPICTKVEEENTIDQPIFSKLRSRFPRLMPFHEDGPSKPWGCAQAGDCVEEALHTPARNTLLSLKRNRLTKTLFLKGDPGQEFPGKVRKSGPISSQPVIGLTEHGATTSSKTQVA